MRTVRLGALAAALLALAACGREQAPAKTPPLPALATIVVQADGGGAVRGWDGVVEAVRQAELTAQTAGRVSQVLADVNSRVPAGAVLLRLSAVEQQAGANTARAQLRAAEAAAQEAEQSYRRYAALAGGQYVSKAQIDNARAMRDSAIAARDAARAQLAQAAQQADYTVVRAPYAGIVARRHVEPGESVAPGQPLMTVYAPGALRIEVQVPQSQADAIRAASTATVTLADGRVVEPRSITVFPTADAATHSVAVRLDLREIDRAPTPGTTAKVSFPIPAESGEGRVGDIRIPAAALAQRGELAGAYVIDGDRVLLRQLRIGAREGETVTVLAGLKAGETIAADPVAALQAVQAQRKAAKQQ
ncbi:efflux RND transporter periplasmic adaptor subunit [Thermomonas brevis]